MFDVLSLGAGVQSSTLAMLAANGELPKPDLAVFADTMAEPPSVYRWLDWLEAQLPFPVVRAAYGDLGREAVRLKRSMAGRLYNPVNIPAYLDAQRGQEGALPRQCTRDYKVAVVRREAKRVARRGRVRMWMGISVDEVHRMRATGLRWVENWYPLVELGWTRARCLAWWEGKQLPPPPRSACVFCPYHSDREWLRLKREEPEAFEAAVQFERRLQESKAQTGLRAVPYLHASRQPLDQCDFDPHRDQVDLFGSDCQGMCGV